MIRQIRTLFCDQEHGTGDVCFPDLSAMDSFEIGEELKNPRTAKTLRSKAKEEGWGFIHGRDYCPSCLALEKE